MKTLSAPKTNILTLLVNADAPLSTKQIANALGMVYSRVRAHLYELRGDGAVKRDVKARTWTSGKVEYRRNPAEPVAAPVESEVGTAPTEAEWADLGRADDADFGEAAEGADGDADLDAAAMREDSGIDDTDV